MMGRVFTGAGRATTAIKNNRWGDAAGIGLQVAGDITRSDALTDVGGLVEHGSALQRAVRSGDWTAADLAAGQFGQSLGNTVEHYRARNLPVPGALPKDKDGLDILPVRNIPGLNQLVAPTGPGGAAAPGQAPVFIDGTGLSGTGSTTGTTNGPLTYSVDVRIAQDLLNQRLGTTLKVDGLLGDNTRAAIAQFQRQVGLPATGNYDARTQSALETGSINPAGSSTATPPPGVPADLYVPPPPGKDPAEWNKQVVEGAKWAAKLQKLYIDVAGEGADGQTLTKLYGIQDAIKGVQSAFKGDEGMAALYMARVAGGALKYGAEAAKSKYVDVIKGLEQTPVTQKFAQDFLAGFDKLKNLGRVLNAPLNAYQFLDSAKKALTGSGLDGKSINSGVPLLDFVNRANVIRGAVTQAKWFAPELYKALDFALGGVPSSLADSLKTKLGAQLEKALVSESAEKVTLFLQKLSTSRLGPVIDKCISKGGNLAVELGGTIGRWAGPLGIGFDVTKTFLELMAPEINAARKGLNAGLGAQASGGSYEYWYDQVSGKFGDPNDANASFETNKWFRDRFLTGGSGIFAGDIKKEFENHLRTQDPQLYALYKENWKVHDARTEARLTDGLQMQATMFLLAKIDQVSKS
ncbi:MAG: peptidoglycan-binding domain-containing protein [Myxococcota bacterium]